MTLHVHLFFFQLFQSETAELKCKKVGLYGKTRAKIWVIYIDPLDLFACLQKPLQLVRGEPKPEGKKTRKKSDLLFLVKKNENCPFLAKNH